MRRTYGWNDILVMPDDLRAFAWSAPMRDLAAQLDLSDVGLKKLLASYGVEKAAVRSLFGFNLGVELGQAAVVAVVYPAVYWLHRRPTVAPAVVRVLSCGLVLAGGFWLFERAAG